MNTILRSAVLSALLASAGVASSATMSVGSATAPLIGGGTNPATIAFSYVGDGVTVGHQCDISFDASRFQATVTPENGAADCTANNTTGNIRVQSPLILVGGVLQPLPDAVHCNIVFTYTPDAADVNGDTFPLDVNGCLASDSGANATTANELDGTITISAGPPPDVVVTFTPASGGTVAFPGGAPGDTPNGSIAVGNTGTIGSGTVNNCVISGADAGAFSVTGGDPTTAPPGGNITLEATLGAAALTATLTCDVADSGGASTATWTLTAPAGTTLAAPTLGATPASGTAITLPTSTGTPVSSPIAIAPTAAGDTGGPAATLACSATAGFTVAPASLTFAAGSAVGQNVMVGCTPDTADAAGSVSCTGSDASGAITWSWPVTCPAAVDAPPAPTFIPATSLWSKLALFGVFAALGMLVLGLRRNH